MAPGFANMALKLAFVIADNAFDWLYDLCMKRKVGGKSI
jgi:hypothetical protein